MSDSDSTPSIQIPKPLKTAQLHTRGYSKILQCDTSGVSDGQTKSLPDHLAPSLFTYLLGALERENPTLESGGRSLITLLLARAVWFSSLQVKDGQLVAVSMPNGTEQITFQSQDKNTTLFFDTGGGGHQFRSSKFATGSTHSIQVDAAKDAKLSLGSNCVESSTIFEQHHITFLPVIHLGACAKEPPPEIIDHLVTFCKESISKTLQRWANYVNPALSEADHSRVICKAISKATQETAKAWFEEQGLSGPAWRGWPQKRSPNFISVGELVRHSAPGTVEDLTGNDNGQVGAPSMSSTIYNQSEVVSRLVRLSLELGLQL